MEYLEKIAAMLILPPSGPILLALVGLWLAWRDWRFGKTLVFTGLAALWLLATPWLSDQLRYSLERHYPPMRVDELPRADAIVVLGGGLEPPNRRNPYPDLGAASDRYWHTARLWHAGKVDEILISGGALPWRDARASEAESAVTLLAALGVPADRIVLEPASLNTRQNADLSASLLRARGAEHILLVTSALHMARAKALFERTGLRITPAATDHEIGLEPFGALRLLPDSDALDGSARAIKEYLARWTGR